MEFGEGVGGGRELRIFVLRSIMLHARNLEYMGGGGGTIYRGNKQAKEGRQKKSRKQKKSKKERAEQKNNKSGQGRKGQG